VSRRRDGRAFWTVGYRPPMYGRLGQHCGRDLREPVDVTGGGRRVAWRQRGQEAVEGTKPGGGRAIAAECV
jgi:hypothetical protein